VFVAEVVVAEGVIAVLRAGGDDLVNQTAHLQGFQADQPIEISKGHLADVPADVFTCA
jgi:hypothetical protein